MIYSIVQSIIFVSLVMITLKSKKTSGHKTDIAFQRYNLVTEEEMVGMKWLDLKNEKRRTMDTYMDTKAL